MKATFVSLLGFAMVFPALVHGQTSIQFSNIPTTFLTPADRYVYTDFIGGQLLVGTQFRAQLYVGTSSQNLVPANAAIASFREPGTTMPGTWVPVTVPLPTGFETPGSTLTLQVRVWDSTYGATYESTLAGYKGASAPFTLTIPSVGGGNPSGLTLENLRAFSLAQVPEPSIFALGPVALLGWWKLRGTFLKVSQFLPASKLSHN
jgi:hypothetical protein